MFTYILTNVIALNYGKTTLQFVMSLYLKQKLLLPALSVNDLESLMSLSHSLNASISKSSSLLKPNPHSQSLSQTHSQSTNNFNTKYSQSNTNS